MIGLIAAGVGAAASAWGGSKAAREQERASKRAIALQYDQMAKARKLYAPYREAGEDAVAQYQDNIGNHPTYENTLANLVNDPGYQFRLQQGQETLENSAAARGMALSGAALKDLQGYSQGMASQEGQAAYTRDLNAYNNTQNQLGNLMQLGFNAVSGQAGMGAQSANNLANLAIQQGNNSANYYTQMGNVANNLAGNIALSSLVDGWGFGGSSGGGNALAMAGTGQNYWNYV